MPRNKYPEETVQKILDVSLKLFMEKGYEQTTVLDIVDNLGGMTRGAFYHHFKSKEAVLDALDDKLYFCANPFQSVKDAPDLNGLEKIKKGIKLNFEDTELQTVNIASIPLFKNPHFLAKYFEGNKKIVLPLLEELIQIGMEDGSIEKANSKVLAEALFLIVSVWTIPSIFPCTKQELIDKIAMGKKMLEVVGLPVLDDDIMAYIDEIANKMDFE